MSCLLLFGCIAANSASANSNDQARLQSIKQQALALYTLRLADQRQFSPSAQILLGQDSKDLRIRSLQIAIDGQAKIQHQFQEREAGLLGRGAMQALGLRNLSSGAHEFDVAIEWSSGGKVYSQQQTRVLRLDAWPRGLNISLLGSGKSAKLELVPQIDGVSILRSAQYEDALGHALRALTQLQLLAQVDPAIGQSPAALKVQARSLRDWGLGRVAQTSFAALAKNPAANETTRRKAQLEASRLALRNQQSGLDTRLSEAMIQSWPEADRRYAELLEVQNLLAAGAVEDAIKALPDDGPALQRYNIAAQLFAMGQQTRAEQILAELSQLPTPADELQARVQDLARLKLAWLRMQQGDAESAATLFTQVRSDGPYAHRALLGRGWNRLIPYTKQRVGMSVANDDGFRPMYVQAIDAALRDSVDGKAENALKFALSDWARLQDADPLEPAVQEAQAATAYALLKLGDYERAIQYGELLIGRVEAVREHLKSAMRQARKGLALNGNQLVAGNWPPAPSSWARDFVVGNWWKDAGANPTIPENAYRMRLLSQPDTAGILESMHALNQVEVLMDAVAEHPDLNGRAIGLRKRIEAERAARQKALDQNAYYWLRLELDRATRYLILSRFSLAHAYAQQENRP